MAPQLVEGPTTHYMVHVKLITDHALRQIAQAKRGRPMASHLSSPTDKHRSSAHHYGVPIIQGSERPLRCAAPGLRWCCQIFPASSISSPARLSARGSQAAGFAMSRLARCFISSAFSHKGGPIHASPTCRETKAHTPAPISFSLRISAARPESCDERQEVKANMAI